MYTIIQFVSMTGHMQNNHVSGPLSANSVIHPHECIPDRPGPVGRRITEVRLWLTTTSEARLNFLFSEIQVHSISCGNEQSFHRYLYCNLCLERWSGQTSICRTCTCLLDRKVFTAPYAYACDGLMSIFASKALFVAHSVAKLFGQSQVDNISHRNWR